MELKDLAGLGELGKKFIDVIAQGLGNATAARFLKRDMKAIGEGIKTVDEALANSRNPMNVEFNSRGLSIKTSNADLIQRTAQEEMIERMFERMAYEELKKQNNLEQIAAHAQEEIADKEEVSEEKVDPDWINRFFTIAADVSTEDMQKLWGKILAGEVIQPGSYSLRTLDLLKNLNQQEAQVFLKIANLAFKRPNSAGAFIPKYKRDTSDLPNVILADILLLQELGILLEPDLALSLEFEQGKSVHLECGQTVIVIQTEEAKKTISIPIIAFSTIGNELLSLVQQTPNIEFGKYITTTLANFAVKAGYYNILERAGNQIKILPVP